MIEAKYIWLDGKMIAFKDAKIHILSHSLHYGNAVFEGLRAYKSDKGTYIFRLKEHTKRLFQSAKIIKIQPNFSEEEINKAQIELLRANDFQKNVYIRPLIFLGAGPMGVYHAKAVVCTMIAAWEWGAYLGEDALSKGIKVMVSSFRRSSTVFNQAKVSANYLNSQMAKYEAVHAGFDEALLLDEQGFVAEGSAECFFMIKDGVLISPPSSYALKSITQDSVIKLAKDLNIKVKRRVISRDELYTCDEAFFTGTAAELTPIKSIDHREITSEIGQITKSLQKAYFDLVYAKNDKYKDFLTKI